MHTPRSADLDRFLVGLDFPMFVVTAESDGEKSGCLVGFVTQASLEPQRLLVCLSVANRTFDIAQRAELLAVHLLRPEQHELASLFGSTTGDEIDKFAQCGWTNGPGNVPLLADCAGRVVGAIRQRVPFGDHVGFLLDPLEVERTGDGPVLTYQQVKDLQPGHPA